MSITDREWQWLRREFGDLAYEHPECHAQWLRMMPRPRLVVDNTKTEKAA